MRADNSIPGCLYPHPKTGGFRWKVPARFAPESLRAEKPDRKFLYVPMIPRGRRRPTRSRKTAEQVRRKIWRRWTRSDAPPGPPDLEMLLDQFRLWNRQTATREETVRSNVAFVRRYLAQQKITDPELITRWSIQQHLIHLAGEGEAPRIDGARKALSGGLTGPGADRTVEGSGTRLCPAASRENVPVSPGRGSTNWPPVGPADRGPFLPLTPTSMGARPVGGLTVTAAMGLPAGTRGQMVALSPWSSGRAAIPRS